MMTSKSKRKGNQFEYESVKALEDVFAILSPYVERAFMSDGRSIGEAADCDVRMKFRNDKFIVQCKRRRELPKWFLQTNSDILMTRRDRGQRYYCFTEKGLKKMIEFIINNHISLD
jgi:hypothetical protein